MWHSRALVASSPQPSVEQAAQDLAPILLTAAARYVSHPQQSLQTSLQLMWITDPLDNFRNSSSGFQTTLQTNLQELYNSWSANSCPNNTVIIAASILFCCLWQEGKESGPFGLVSLLLLNSDPPLFSTLTHPYAGDDVDLPVPDRPCVTCASGLQKHSYEPTTGHSCPPDVFL